MATYQLISLGSTTTGECRKPRVLRRMEKLIAQCAVALYVKWNGIVLMGEEAHVKQTVTQLTRALT
jgi:hypothetical protein